MNTNTLKEANSLNDKIYKAESRINNLNKLIANIDSGILRLEITIYKDGLCYSHNYDDKEKYFGYILGAIKAKYEKELKGLKEQFDKL